jgi:sarcosine oxidase subunit gamma
MLDSGLKPVPALAGIARAGRHGARTGAAGLTLQERDGLRIVSLAARRRQADALADAVRARWGIDLPVSPRFVEGAGVAFVWSGAEQWLAVAETGDLEATLRAAVGSLASITAQGDGRVVLRLSGPRSRDVLAAVVPIDLHPRAFRPGDTAMTLAGHIAVQIRLVDDDFELMAFRGYAGSLFQTVLHAGLEFGVDVLPPQAVA